MMADIEKVSKGLCEAIGIIHGYVGKRYWGYGEQACRDAIKLLGEQEQLKIALSEGQKQVQNLLSSGRELEETINILKGEIERLRQEKDDVIERIKRMAEEIPKTPAKTETDGIYLSGKYWGMRDALDIINKPPKEGEA